MVFGERLVRLFIEGKLHSHVREHALREVHPYVRHSDGRQVARIVQQALSDARPIWREEARHARVACCPQLRVHLDLALAHRHLVVRIEQPVGGKAAAQVGTSVGIEHTSDVHVE